MVRVPSLCGLVPGSNRLGGARSSSQKTRLLDGLNEMSFQNVMFMVRTDTTLGIFTIVVQRRL